MPETYRAGSPEWWAARLADLDRQLDEIRLELQGLIETVNRLEGV